MGWYNVNLSFGICAFACVKTNSTLTSDCYKLSKRFILQETHVLLLFGLEFRAWSGATPLERR